MNNILNKLKFFILTLFFRLLYGSCRWQVEGIEHLEKVIKDNHSAILAYWHGNMLIPYYKLAKYKFHILAGFHRDAELGVMIGKNLGWKFFRGSSSKKGSEVFQEILGFLQEGNNIIVFTPDGPKGPAKIPKPGAVRASQKLAIPIIPIAGRSLKSWGFKNWDTFHLTKPFTKIVLKIGGPLKFTQDDDFEACNEKLKNTLNKLEQDVKNILNK